MAMIDPNAPAPTPKPSGGWIIPEAVGEVNGPTIHSVVQEDIGGVFKAELTFNATDPNILPYATVNGVKCLKLRMFIDGSEIGALGSKYHRVPINADWLFPMQSARRVVRFSFTSSRPALVTAYAYARKKKDNSELESERVTYPNRIAYKAYGYSMSFDSCDDVMLEDVTLDVSVKDVGGMIMNNTAARVVNCEIMLNSDATPVDVGPDAYIQYNESSTVYQQGVIKKKRS